MSLLPCCIRKPSLAIALCTVLDAPLAAETTLHPYARFASEYAVHGLPASNQEPVMQAGAELALGRRWFAGAATSGVEFASDRILASPRSREVSAYAGYTGEARLGSYELSVARYWYPGASRDYGYTELAAFIHVSDVVSLGVIQAIDALGEERDGRFAELTLRYPFTGNLSASGGLGSADLARKGADYSYANLGFSYLMSAMSFDLRGYFSGGAERGTLIESRQGSRVVFSVGVGF